MIAVWLRIRSIATSTGCTRDGFPIAHEVCEGNTEDCRTLGKMLDLIDKRVGLKPGQTVVVDRGMVYDDNLKEITERNLHYIVASRQSERDVWLADLRIWKDSRM